VRLLYLASSPYARKSLVCAHELGLDRGLEVASVETSPEINRVNPLGKVPVLLRDNGPDLFDSAVICEYFDSPVVGAMLFPRADEERWRSLRMHALADGMCDAAIAIRRERNRPPALRWPDWEQAHLRKLDQAYDLLEREALPPSEPVEIGQIALATALG
jgi:glutathione S-transferase